MMIQKRSVSFGSLAVDEFALGVGDNPSVSGGVPVALSHHRTNSYNMDIDQFERLRRKKSQNKVAVTVMDPDTRRKM